MNMRKRLSHVRQFVWDKAIEKHPEGVILSTRLLVVRAVLFPIGFLRWYLYREGYDPRTDAWHVNGHVFSGRALRALTKANGCLFTASVQQGFGDKPSVYIVRTENQYDPITDIWTLYGVKYTGDFLRALADANGEPFTIQVDHGVLRLEKAYQPGGDS